MVSHKPHNSARTVASWMPAILAIIVLVPASAGAKNVRSQTPFCKALNNPQLNPNGQIYSAGGQMYCFGLQRNGSTVPTSSPSLAASIIANVDAASTSEDVAPNGTQAYGQSETSIAAVDQYVVEGWNDATGFVSPCPSPNNKESGTGFGFSNNGGNSFVDMGGIPNDNCASFVSAGDPSVEAWEYQGTHYFYISYLYPSATGLGANNLGLTACKVAGSGTSATLECGQPIIAATSSQCISTPAGTVCSFLDKDFLSIDPQRGRLYMSYTDFEGNSDNPTGVPTEIGLAVCNIKSNPLLPVCSNGSKTAPAPPYLVIARPDVNGCENEGAYPAVDVRPGDVYVAYEHNWGTNLSASGPCLTEPVADVMTYVPKSCLTLPKASCASPAHQTSELVTSLSAAFIPGYNRFPMNDFPRIAVSDPAGTVSMVWNDARFAPLGDILLQSFELGSLTPFQSEPVRVDNDAQSGEGFKMLPALRKAEDDGTLPITWFSRKTTTTSLTDYYAALGVDPKTTSTPASNIRITNVSSDWVGVSSDIVPNFGDYTDNYVGAIGTAPFSNETLFAAWSDGRKGVPQPFEAHVVH